MKKLVVFAMVAMSLTIFNGCQKDELNVSQLADEAEPQEVVKPDVYVEADYLVFKDFETLDSFKKDLNQMTKEQTQELEKKLGFISAFSFKNKAMEKVEQLSDSELTSYLLKLASKGYFSKDEGEFVYPFYNESYAKVLNVDGKVKIAKTFYQFQGTTEIITPDVSGFEVNIEDKKLVKKINLNAGLNQLKSGEELGTSLLADDRLRCSLKLIREQYDVYDWIIDPIDGIVWGYVGTNWEVYYRFYSYKQYALYKSNRPTYFNWKTQQARVGGNNEFWYLNYYNANPYTERSTEERDIYHFVIYSSGLIYTWNIPNVSAVNVCDFWSDYMSSVHGSLVYP